MVLVAAQKSQRLMVIADLNRLTHAALLILVENTKRLQWLGGSPAQTALGEPLTSERPGTTLSTLPPLSHWLEDVEVPEYPFDNTWEEAQKSPVLVIHSSGITGIPRPLRYTLDMTATFNLMRRFPDRTHENPNLQFDHLFDSRAFWTAPPQCIPIWPPSHEGTPTPTAVIEEVLDKTNPDGAFYAPSTLRGLCLKDRSLKTLKKHHKYLLCTEIHLVTIVGSTETSWWPLQKLDDRRDWRYYRIDPRLGHHLEPFDNGGAGDDLYELVIHRNPAWRRFQGAFIMWPNLDVYHTQDLYSPHPTKPDLVWYRGRKDDLVKLVWLTKVWAHDIESALVTYPKIEAAMVGGEGKEKPFVIVQACQDAGVKGLDADELWDVVKGLNEKMSAEVHILRENVILADQEKPLKKLAKGTLDRRGILADYNDEVEKLYAGTMVMDRDSKV
ncbi:uncharacterized protein BCR38DRAFT_480371 [Pseudomassariella vexata]|uniref:Uncharacterized protein n=1 Tax=Pseudomassariella vexata TaxID=1141098 RepID=A0A1Y2EKR2_9PEZI|nr:uncharacterized protein BCR38DRAFT_480371 [Pseudomassariella vexata]ORY71894.1 hypothetical protein BCR38DRAFT_480371 [Pseudomassariella vexata]